MNFDVLYYFMNENFNVIEVKRTDREETAHASELYYWLYIPTETLLAERLHFKSMSEETVNGNLINVREFDSAELRFDDAFAKFQIREHGHILMNTKITEVPQNILDTVKKYLN